MTGRPAVRVLSLIGSLAVGGAETYLARIAPEIAKHGVEMEICALERRGPRLDDLERAGIVVHGTPFEIRSRRSSGPTVVRTIDAIRRIVKNGRFDIVQTYLYWSDILGVIGAKAAGCPRIIVSRRALHRWIHKPQPVLHWLEQFTNMLADEMIANSRTVLLDAEANEQILPRVRTVVYNGVDVGRYQPSTPSLTGPLRLVTVGALAPRKGQEYAIEAVAMMKRSGVDVTLELVGSGSDEAMLRRRVAGEDLDSVIRFGGEQVDPRPNLGCADVFVLPSRQEGFSNAILEAMACGLAVVATDVGGNAEAVVDGQGGFIVPREDPQALVKALTTLANDRARVIEMGRYNRERVTELFSLEASARRLADWYRGGRSLRHA